MDVEWATRVRPAARPLAASLVCVLGATALLAAGLAAVRVMRAVTLPWVIVPIVPADIYGLPRPEGLPPGAHAYAVDAGYAMLVDVVPLGQRLFLAAGQASGPLAVAVGAAALARLGHLWASRSTPFTRQAPRLVAAVAAAVAVAGVVAPLVHRAAATAVVADLGPETRVHAAVTVQWWWLPVSLGIAALVPVFASGRRLQDAAEEGKE